MVDSSRLPITVGVEFVYMPKSDMNTVSLYLANHERLSVSVDQARLIRNLSPDLSVTELDHLFLFDNAPSSKMDSDRARIKRKKHLKKLEQLNCTFKMLKNQKS